MAIITSEYTLDFSPGSVPVVIHMSQYDAKARSLKLNLLDSVGVIEFDSSMHAAVRGTKPDGNGFDYAESTGGDDTLFFNYSGGYVTFTPPEQVAAVAGKVICEVYIYKGTQGGSDYRQIATANFVILVERAALDKDTLISGSEIRQLVDVIDRTDELIEAAETVESAVAQVDADAAAAAASATGAAGSASAAASSAASASTSETNAAASATAASSSASAASGSATAAAGSATTAADSATAASSSASAASGSATAAAGSATTAADSATAASTSATAAAASAAAAEAAGAVYQEKVDDILESLGNVPPSANLLNPSGWEDGYYSTGVWTESTTYATSNYMAISGSKVYVHRFSSSTTKADTSRYFQYAYWFTGDKAYSSRTSISSGDTELAIPTDAAYVRMMAKISDLNSDATNNRVHYTGLTDTNTFIAYDPGGLPDYVEIISDINSNISGLTDDVSGLTDDVSSLQGKVGATTVALADNIFTITAPRAVYTFRRVTKASENIDTWRLYSGALRNADSTFTMWSNSDAEGAIKISGETDFVCGFHGSEIMTAFAAYLDGVNISSQTAIEEREFRTLEFYVESDVYHCYQDAAVADTKAFKRNKIVCFDGDTVRVSNHYTALEALSVAYARITLFQCYKAASGVPVFTDFSVNSDFMRYTVADVATSHPAESAKMTEATLQTTYGRIAFKSLYTSGQKYRGFIQNFQSQNRIKFYFDTIASTTAVASGEVIQSQFEFTIM